MKRILTSLLICSLALTLATSCCALGLNEENVILPGLSEHDQGESGSD